MLFWAYHRNTPRKLTPSSFSPTTIITRYHPSLQAVNSQTPLCCSWRSTSCSFCFRAARRSVPCRRSRCPSSARAVALEGAPAEKKGEKIWYVGYRSNIDEYRHDIGWFFKKTAGFNLGCSIHCLWNFASLNRFMVLNVGTTPLETIVITALEHCRCCRLHVRFRS